MKASDVRLTGLYVISFLAMVFGVCAVFLLNIATPTDFIFDRFAELKAATESSYIPFVARRLVLLFLIILLIALPSMFIMYALLRPVSQCLNRMKNGLEVENGRLEQVRRRIINLPFFFVGILACLWVVLPILIFTAAYMAGFMDIRTAAVFSASAPAWWGLLPLPWPSTESRDHCRKGLVPIFFPEGQLAGLKKAQHLVHRAPYSIFLRDWNGAAPDHVAGHPDYGSVGA
jgi:hypothetical protein